MLARQPPKARVNKVTANVESSFFVESYLKMFFQLSRALNPDVIFLLRPMTAREGLIKMKVNADAKIEVMNNIYVSLYGLYNFQNFA